MATNGPLAIEATGIARRLISPFWSSEQPLRRSSAVAIRPPNAARRKRLGSSRLTDEPFLRTTTSLQNSEAFFGQRNPPPDDPPVTGQIAGRFWRVNDGVSGPTGEVPGTPVPAYLDHASGAPLHPAAREELLDRLRRRTDPGDPGCDHRAREVGVLRQEAVAGMDRVCAGPARGLEHQVGAEVGLGRRTAGE